MAANLINEDFAAPVLDTRYRIGAWVAVASIAMLFTALSSAYVVRAASASDWQPLAVPRVLWLSTLVLVASSGAIEMARRNLRHSLAGQFSRWLALAGLLAIGFLALQFTAWKQLAAQGIFLASNPHSSFFYLLTALHGLHLLGGLLALAFLLLYVSSTAGPVRAARGRGFTEAAAIYWHFLAGLWIYLFVLLFVWKSV